MSEIRTDTINNASGDNDSGIDLSTNDVVIIKTANTEIARVTSADVLIGATDRGQIVNDGTVGICLGNDGQILASRIGNVAVFDREDSDGDIILFRKDGSTIGSIGTANSGDIYIANDDVSLMMAGGSDAVIPRGTAGALRDDVIDLGVSSNRFDNIFATNGTINTSDRNEKQDIEELTEAEQRVAVACKALMRKYRWKKAVTEKGDNARIHFGIIAQDLQDAFTAEGLDASKYALFCSDTWWEADEKYTDDDGKEQTRLMDYHTEEEAPEGAIKKTRLGVRYTELLAFIISAI